MKKFGVIAITATAISSILWVWSIAKNTTGDTKPSDTNEKVEEKLAVADRFLALAILLSKKEEEQRKLFTQMVVMAFGVLAIAGAMFAFIMRAIFADVIWNQVRWSEFTTITFVIGVTFAAFWFICFFIAIYKSFINCEYKALQNPLDLDKRWCEKVRNKGEKSSSEAWLKFQGAVAREMLEAEGINRPVTQARMKLYLSGQKYLFYSLIACAISIFCLFFLPRMSARATANPVTFGRSVMCDEYDDDEKAALDDVIGKYDEDREFTVGDRERLEERREESSERDQDRRKDN